MRYSYRYYGPCSDYDNLNHPTNRNGEKAMSERRPVKFYGRQNIRHSVVFHKLGDTGGFCWRNKPSTIKYLISGDGEISVCFLAQVRKRSIRNSKRKSET